MIPNGIVSADYSNGQVKAIYQIPLATFNSENSLQESTGDVYQQTTGSGTYYLRAGKYGRRGRTGSFGSGRIQHRYRD